MDYTIFPVQTKLTNDKPFLLEFRQLKEYFNFRRQFKIDRHNKLNNWIQGEYYLIDRNWLNKWKEFVNYKIFSSYNLNRDIDDNDYYKFIDLINNNKQEKKLFSLDNSNIYNNNGEINPFAEFIIINKKCKEIFGESRQNMIYNIIEKSVPIKFLKDKLILNINNSTKLICFRNELNNVDEEVIIIFINNKNNDKILYEIENEDFKGWLKNRSFEMTGPDELELEEQECKFKIINKNLKLKQRNIIKNSVVPNIGDNQTLLIKNQYILPNNLKDLIESQVEENIRKTMGRKKKEIQLANPFYVKENKQGNNNQNNFSNNNGQNNIVNNNINNNNFINNNINNFNNINNNMNNNNNNFNNNMFNNNMNNMNINQPNNFNQNKMNVQQINMNNINGNNHNQFPQMNLGQQMIPMNQIQMNEMLMYQLQMNQMHQMQMNQMQMNQMQMNQMQMNQMFSMPNLNNNMNIPNLEMMKAKSEDLNKNRKNQNVPINQQKKIENPFINDTFPHKAGLLNVGQSCYMNATIECLSNIRSLTDELLKGYGTFDINKQPLCVSYSCLLYELFNTKDKYIEPKLFKEIIGKLNPLFEGNHAADSKDLIFFIIETLHNELLPPQQNNNNNEIDFNQQEINSMDEKKMFNDFIKELQIRCTIISDIFYGINRYVTKCYGCNTSKYSFQTFNLLIFPLKKVKEYKMRLLKGAHNLDLNLYDAFYCEQEEEKLEGDNMIYCNRCKQLSPGAHKQDIYGFPRILIIILNRGKNNQDFNEEFKFDEVLDFSNKNISVNKKSIKKFYLCGIIKHLGASGSSGHFIAYCRNSLNDNFICYNDAAVNPVSTIDAMSANISDRDLEKKTPYILLYHYMN